MPTPDDPQEIADYLIAEHGLERALQTAQEGTATAHREQDNYGVSVWREVKVILNALKEAKRMSAE